MPAPTIRQSYELSDSIPDLKQLDKDEDEEEVDVRKFRNGEESSLSNLRLPCMVWLINKMPSRSFNPKGGGDTSTPRACSLQPRKRGPTASIYTQ